MKKQKQQKQNKPKSGLASFCVSVTALILVFAVCFTFLIFSTDVVINVDTQTRTNTEVVRPTQVSITIQKVEDLTGSNGSGDGTPNPPPDNTGVTPPPGTTPVIDKELKEWVDNCPIKFTKTDKQDTLAVMYYVLNKNGYSDEQICGILGNMCIEGSIGRFEDIPYGRHGGSRDYYANTWNVSSFYDKFTDYTVSRYGNKAHEYSEIYANKVAQDNNMTWSQLRTMFDVAANTTSNLFGFGSIQMTDHSYHEYFIKFIDTNSLTALTDFYTVAEMETGALLTKAQSHFNQNTPSGYSAICGGAACTVDDVRNAVGYTSGPEAEVIEAATIFYCRVERVAGGETVANVKNRASWGVTCYQDIKAAGY